ncbi:MAG TPA: HEAT repeat domain-containing protein [Fimbriiglobus sp.]|nr:HEAT repeat domain-containing protein [Fimbriiglobus sp.]
MVPVRPAGWVVAVALVAAGCSDKPAPTPPTKPAPVLPSPPGAVVAALPQPTPATQTPAPAASPPGGPGWVYPQLPNTIHPPAGTPPELAPAPALAAKPQSPVTTMMPPGTQTPPSVPGVPPAPPGTSSSPPVFPPTPAPKKEEPKKGPAKKGEYPKSVNGRSLGEWLGDFKSPDPAVRDSAIKVVPLFGPEARKVAPKELIRLIANDPDPGVLINAILILGAVGTDNKDELHAAARALGGAIAKAGKGSMIRLHAARTLAAMGTDGYEAIPAMIGIANDPSWEIRQASAAALGRLGAPIYEDKPPVPGAPYKLPAIKRQPNMAAMHKLVFALLKDECAAVRMETMQSMIVLGPPYTANPAAYPSLVAPYLAEINQRLKQEKDDTVKIWLYVAQMMYDDRTVDANMKLIAEYLTAREDAQKVQALGALAVLGPRARPVVTDIAQCVKDPEPTVVVAALTTLVTMGTAAKFALGELEKQQAAIKDKDKDLKQLFEKAIKIIKEGKAEPEKKDEKKKEEKKK